MNNNNYHKNDKIKLKIIRDHNVINNINNVNHKDNENNTNNVNRLRKAQSYYKL